MDYTLEQLQAQRDKILDSFKNFDAIMYSIFLNMATTGARFNDVYEVKRWTLLESGMLQLEPQKRNNLRYFSRDQVDTLLLDQIVTGENYYSKVSYSNCLFWYKRFSDGLNLNVKTMAVQTHLFRHIKAKELKEDGMTDIEVQNYLGERHLISAHSYINSRVFSK